MNEYKLIFLSVGSPQTTITSKIYSICWEKASKYPQVMLYYINTCQITRNEHVYIEDSIVQYIVFLF